MVARLISLWALLSSIVFAQNTSYFFPNNTFYPSTTVSAACSNAILGQVNCMPDLLSYTYADTFYPLNNATYQKQFCNTTCGTSLSAYVSNVTKSCAGQASPFDNLPAAYYGNWAWSSWNTTCLQDSKSGNYCIDYFFGLFPNTSTTEMTFSQIAPAKLCTECVYKMFKQMQGTPYSTYDANIAADWSSVQSICSVSAPTAVPTRVNNGTVGLPGYAPNITYSATCLSGKTYTAVSGDNIAAISQKQNVSTGTLLAINQLLPDGSDLQGGQVLCLPYTCNTHQVVQNDTCAQLSTTAGVSLPAFLGFNPTINQFCTNLILGQNVCLSPPGGMYNATTIAGTIPTQTAVYATATVTPPGPTAHGTTTNCGKYYQVQSGDFCQVVALNQTISLPLFQAINPDIDIKCDNLVPGLWYCVSPLQYWNQTGSPTQPSDIPPPTTTPDGTTDDCYQWYTIQSGDNCALVERSFGITFSQLQLWNPNLNNTCGNLLLGEAYCVQSPQSTSNPPNTVTAAPTSTSPTSTVASTTSTTVPAPSPTMSGTTANCYKWYVVQSGDTCDKIGTANSITLAQFQYWNKSVNSGCTNIQPGYAYCVNSPDKATSKAKRTDGLPVGPGGWPVVSPVAKMGLPPKFPGLAVDYDKIVRNEL